MVWGVVQNFQKALKYRGGWRNLLEHMYTNGDYPFKFGTYMGCDAAGNRYYENRVDYPYGQHRWVEPGDIHNFDSSSIAPEWHGWMTSMNDSTPTTDESFIEERKKNFIPVETPSLDLDHNVGHTEKFLNFHNMHNQSQVRSRGYGIGNAVTYLPPGAPDAYYTQPGSPYNEASIRKLEYVGDLDEATGGGRPYKSQKWAERLTTAAEKEAKANKQKSEYATYLEQMKNEAPTRGRGSGTMVGK